MLEVHVPGDVEQVSGCVVSRAQLIGYDYKSRKEAASREPQAEQAGASPDLVILHLPRDRYDSFFQTTPNRPFGTAPATASCVKIVFVSQAQIVRG
jgi:hypothetical protein